MDGFIRQAFQIIDSYDRYNPNGAEQAYLWDAAAGIDFSNVVDQDCIGF